MMPHKTKEKVTLETAFFHPRQTNFWIKTKWFRVLADALKLNVTLVTGVFDVWHPEHTAFLAAAAEQGDLLFVGLESDARVTKLKGPGRPIHPQHERVLQLRNKSTAHRVVVLPDDFSDAATRRNFLRALKPSVLAVSEHTPHLEAKQQELSSVGGEVRVVRQHNPVFSSTQLIAQGNLTGVH